MDDDALVRRLLSSILTSQGVDVVADASDGDEVVDAVLAHRPDVVLLDLHMARVGGIEALERLARVQHAPAVIALTSFGTDETVMAALHAGAKGFLAKDADPQEIVAAVERVAAGHGALDHVSAGAAIRHVAAGANNRRRDDARALLATLTERELACATHVPAGLSNAQIGALTFCSESTVKAHLSHAMAKLDVTTRAQLAVVVDRAALGA